MSRLTRTTLLLAFFFAVDKALAIVRQILIAREFGLSRELDAFNAANNLPDLLYALISGGALALAFIPVLSETLTRHGRSQTWDLFSRIANLDFLVTGGFAILVAILARPLVGWELGVAPGFSSVQQDLVASLMRLNLIATLIFSISGLVMAGLQAHQHFLFPAIAPLVYNLGQIFGAIFLAPLDGFQLGPLRLPSLGLGVPGLVYGVILGAVLHLLVQLPALIRYGFHWTPAIGINTPAVRQVLRLLGPRLLTVLFIQFTFLARDNLASRLQEGAVTALTYGWMIMQVPETLIGTAIGTALLPTLAELAARGEWKNFRQTAERAMQVLVALTLPVAAILAAGIGPLIGLAFDFGEEGNILVTWVTRAYLFGIIGHSLLEVAARSFYAQQEARIPLFASALNAIAYAFLGWIMYRPYGAVGIALANTLAYTGEAILLIYLLNRRLPDGQVHLWPTLLRAGLSALVGGGLAWIVILRLPLPLLLATAAGLALGSLVSLPWIRREIRVLVRL